VDTYQLIALIVIALIILAVIIAFRKKIVLALEFLGIKLNVEAENEPEQPPEPPAPPAGVSVEEVEAEGGLLVDEGHSDTGPGVAVKKSKFGDDVIIGKGHSGSPKADPPA